MIPVRFSVIGTPEPKGSAKIVPLRRQFPFVAKSFGELLRSVAVTSDNARVKAWQKSVGQAARLALGGVQLEISGAVEIEAAFFFAVPASYKKSFSGPHTVRPDVDKCLRALLDALTGIVYHDDAQVTRIATSKHYTRDEARVEVTVTPVTFELPLFQEGRVYGLNRSAGAGRLDRAVCR